MKVNNVSVKVVKIKGINSSISFILLLVICGIIALSVYTVIVLAFCL